MPEHPRHYVDNRFQRRDHAWQLCPPIEPFDFRIVAGFRLGEPPQPSCRAGPWTFDADGQPHFCLRFRQHVPGAVKPAAVEILSSVKTVEIAVVNTKQTENKFSKIRYSGYLL